MGVEKSYFRYSYFIFIIHSPLIITISTPRRPEAIGSTAEMELLTTVPGTISFLEYMAEQKTKFEQIVNNIDVILLFPM